MHVHLTLVFVALLWGLNPPVMKLGLPYVEPLCYNALRLLVSLGVGWPLFKILAQWKEFDRKDLKPVIILIPFT